MTGSVGGRGTLRPHRDGASGVGVPGSAEGDRHAPCGGIVPREGEPQGLAGAHGKPRTWAGVELAAHAGSARATLRTVAYEGGSGA